MFNRSMPTRLGAVSAVALLALGPAVAQQTDPQDGRSSAQQQQAQSQDMQGSAQQQARGGSAEEDALVATVGDEELRSSDVMAIIQALPEQVRQQPREVLVPMAIQQAVLREMILQQAMSEELGDDPDVVALLDEQSQMPEEDAMIRVWFQREMDERITDERVEEMYTRLESESEEDLPPLDQVRPQIEQQLGRDAVQGIQSDLSDRISVTYYGPDGEPVETAEADAQNSSDSGSEEDGSGSTSSNGSDGGTSDNGSSESEED